VALVALVALVAAGGMGQGIFFGLPFSLVSDGCSSAGLFRGMP